MNRIAKILRIAGYLSKTPDYYYRTEGSSILLITKSPDWATLNPLKEEAKKLNGSSIRRPVNLPSSFKGAWFEMKDETEAEMLGFILRDELEARPM